jgi:hypothetical protein
VGSPTERAQLEEGQRYGPPSAERHADDQERQTTLKFGCALRHGPTSVCSARDGRYGVIDQSSERELVTSPRSFQPLPSQKKEVFSRVLLL